MCNKIGSKFCAIPQNLELIYSLRLKMVDTFVIKVYDTRIDGFT